MLSPLYADVYRSIADYLQAELGQPVHYRDDVDWRDRQRLLLSGEAQIGFLCGLPYAREAARLELLAAPVMRGERYQDRPIYFSDVVVRQDSPYQTFRDLQGARFAYNEPGSQSGYGIVRYQLARLGLTEAFFGKVVESGAHAESLAMILRGEADASAIDSTVLEREDPTLTSQLRIVEVLGPSPIQPIVASRTLEPVEKVRALLLKMHETGLFEGTPVRRLDPVCDADYDEIRRMEAAGHHIRL